MSDRTATLAERLLRRAAASNLSLATAESCTAGWLATALADAPGAGERFHGGFVVYTKHNKTAALGVPPTLIATHTAVSRPVAEAMARGALERCPADVAIAITGVAGPEPDEDGNPVGLMHTAVAIRRAGIHHRQHSFADAERDALRARAICAALELADRVLQGMPAGTAGKERTA